MTSHSVAQRSTNRANPSAVDEKLYNLGRGKVGDRRQKRVPLQPRESLLFRRVLHADGTSF